MNLHKYIYQQYDSSHKSPKKLLLKYQQPTPMQNCVNCWLTRLIKAMLLTRVHCILTEQSDLLLDNHQQSVNQTKAFIVAHSKKNATISTITFYEWQTKVNAMCYELQKQTRGQCPRYFSCSGSTLHVAFTIARNLLWCIFLPTMVAWHSGRMSVSDWRTVPVLRSTCSWWVTTNVGKPSATGQPTRPTQPFILSGSINE